MRSRVRSNLPFSIVSASAAVLIQMRHSLMTRHQLRNLMLTGPPHSHRRRIWLQVTGAEQQMNDYKGYYQRLLLQQKDSRVLVQVEKDLQRTYRDEGYFEVPGSVQGLRNVLLAYSTRNPSVGYCQGMNFIAGRLLSFGFTEEQAFWMLAQIVEMYLPLDYFTDMMGVKTDQKVFHSLLKLHVPRVAKHLQMCGIDPSMYCVQWLVCIFAYSFRRDIVMRIWDVFFVEGAAFLFRVGLGVMHVCRDVILSTSNEEELILSLDKATKAITDPDLLLLEASLEKFLLKGKQISELRAQYRTQVWEELGVIEPQLPANGNLLGEMSRRRSFLAFNCLREQVIEDYVTAKSGKSVVPLPPSLLIEGRAVPRLAH